METRTFTQVANDRWKAITEIWGWWRWLLSDTTIQDGIAIIAVLGLVGRFILFPSDAGYITNLYTEVISIAITVLVLDRLNQRRQDKIRKEELIFQMGSGENVTARRAARMLHHKGWLTDGTLRASQLSDANLHSSDLNSADLQDADLIGANLKKADLFMSNLRGAILNDANLEGAMLEDSDLRGASLVQANLRGAKLDHAQFDESTVLPNNNAFGIGKKNYWTPETDMTRYTNPEHELFWNPEWAAAGFDSHQDWYVAGLPAPIEDSEPKEHW